LVAALIAPICGLSNFDLIFFFAPNLDSNAKKSAFDLLEHVFWNETLRVLVSAGGLVYALGAILLGAFSRDDLKLLLRRKRKPFQS
jgi:hypothetical protein